MSGAIYFDGEEVPREGMDALLEEQLRTGMRTIGVENTLCSFHSNRVGAITRG